MQLKLRLGKLHLRLPLADVETEQQQLNDIQVLPVAHEHVLALQGLPAHHKDPFDRLLIAQANAAEAGLISHDPMFAHYPINVLW